MGQNIGLENAIHGNTCFFKKIYNTVILLAEQNANKHKIKQKMKTNEKPQNELLNIM